MLSNSLLINIAVLFMANNDAGRSGDVVVKYLISPMGTATYEEHDVITLEMQKRLVALHPSEKWLGLMFEAYLEGDPILVDVIAMPDGQLLKKEEKETFRRINRSNSGWYGGLSLQLTDIDEKNDISKIPLDRYLQKKYYPDNKGDGNEYLASMRLEAPLDIEKEIGKIRIGHLYRIRLIFDEQYQYDFSGRVKVIGVPDQYFVVLKPSSNREKAFQVIHEAARAAKNKVSGRQQEGEEELLKKAMAMDKTIGVTYVLLAKKYYNEERYNECVGDLPPENWSIENERLLG